MLGLNKYSLYIFYFLLAYTPLHVLLSTWLGTSFDILDFAKAAKDVLLIVGFLLLVVSAPLASIKAFLADKLVLIIGFYGLLTVGLAVVKPTDTDAEILAVVYNLRFLIFFIYAGLLSSIYKDKLLRTSVKIVLCVGLLVALLGIAQVVALPNDALSSVGYSRSAGTPVASFISDTTKTTERAFSTIKDPNYLGSYLIIIGMLAAVKLIKQGKHKRKLTALIIPIVLFSLFLTYSRSAWIGGFFAGIALLLALPKTYKFIKGNFKKITIVASVLFLIVGSTVFIYRDSAMVQNTFLHIGDDAPSTSNSQRIGSFNATISKIKDNPLGYGPGTAGPTSIKNQKQGTLLPENYYLQIAYEVGILGASLFTIILVATLIRLTRIKSKDYIKAALIASWVGLLITNLLVHIWANEAVAYTWWGLAGLLILNPKSKLTKNRTEHN